MAQADGSIIIDTEINSDGLRAGSKEIEASLRRMASELDDVGTKAKTALNKQLDAFSKLNREYARQSEKVDELKNKVEKVPTREYKKLQEQLKKDTEELNRLTKAQDWFLAHGGKADDSLYKDQQIYINELIKKIENAKSKIEELKESGKALKNGKNSEATEADIEALARAEEELANVNDKLNTSFQSIKGSIRDYQQALQEENQLKNIAENAKVGNKKIVELNKNLEELKARQKILESAGAGIGYKEYDTNATKIAKLNSRLLEYQKKLTSVDDKQKKTSDSANKMSKSFDRGRMSLGKMIAMSLVMNIASRALFAVTDGLKSGFDNLSQYSSDTNNSLSMLWGSLVRLENALATAFAPILSVVAPILSKFIDMLSTAASYVSMFFSFLSGKSTYTRAIAVQKDYAKSLDKSSKSAKNNADNTKDAADAAEEAAEATEDYLSPLDDLNKYTSQNDSSKSPSSKSPSSGSGGGDGSGSGPMFETVGIDNDFANLMDSILDKLTKIRDIFMDGFWDGLGDYKPMLEELKKDLASIGEHLKDIFTDKDVRDAANRFARSFIYNLGKVVGSFASIGLTIAVNIVGGIESYLSENTDRIKKWLIEMFNVWAVINDIIGNFSAAIAYIFQNTFGTQTAQDLTGDLLGIFMVAFGEVVLLASKLGRDILDALTKPIIENKDKFVEAINNTLEPIEKVAQSIETFLQNVADKLTEFYDQHVHPFFQGIGDGLTEIVGTILDTYNEYVVPILDALAQKVDAVLNGPVGDAIDQLLNVLGKVMDLLTLLWNEVLVPLIDWIVSNILPILALVVGGIISHMLNLVGIVAQVAAEILKVLGKIIDFLVGAFKNDWVESFGIIGIYMKQWAKDIKSFIEGIKRMFNGIIEFFSGMFYLDLNRAMNGLKEMFGGAWQAMAAVVKTPINTIISFMNALLYAAQKMQNGFASAMNHMNIDLPGWLEDLTGYSSIGFNIPYWNAPTIPYLAKGAVIPPNKEFMAVLGDQKSGNNIEAPEALIRKIVREESGSSNTKQRIEVPVYLERRQIYKAVLEEGKIVRTQTGMNPFTL